MFKRLSEQDVDDIIRHLLKELDKKLLLNTVNTDRLGHMAAALAVAVILTATKSAHITRNENTAIMLEDMTSDVITRIQYAMKKVVTEKYNIVKD